MNVKKTMKISILLSLISFCVAGKRFVNYKEQVSHNFRIKSREKKISQIDSFSIILAEVNLKIYFGQPTVEYKENQHDYKFIDAFREPSLFIIIKLHYAITKI